MTQDETHESLPPSLVALATRRRAGIAAFDTITPGKTALLALNMQNAWLATDAPFDRAGRALAILPKINRLAATLRTAGGQIFWLQHTTGARNTPTYWSGYFDHFVRPDLRDEAVKALAETNPLHALYPGADRHPQDHTLPKFRFSAFLNNPHDLATTLRRQGIDTIIIAGTATNICCESTARDAMMRDFRTFMPHDTVTAPDREAHLGGIRSIMQVFADVRPSEDIIALIRNGNP